MRMKNLVSASGRDHVTAKHIKATAPIVAVEPDRAVRPAPEVPFVAPTAARDALAEAVQAFLVEWDDPAGCVDEAVETLRHELCGPMPSADAIAEVVRDARRAVLDAAGRTTDAERKALGARIVRIESAVFNSIIDSD